MRGLILNNTDFEATQLAIHNLLKSRKDYNSPRYASPSIKTTNNLFILIEPKKEWLKAILSLGLKFVNIDVKILLKEKFF